MKKFFCFSVSLFMFLGMGIVTAQAGSCGMNKITLSGINQYPSDNEFLFDSKAAYE